MALVDPKDGALQKSVWNQWDEKIGTALFLRARLCLLTCGALSFSPLPLWFCHLRVPLSAVVSFGLFLNSSDMSSLFYSFRTCFFHSACLSDPTVLVNGTFSFALDFEGVMFMSLDKSFPFLEPQVPHQKLV